MKTNRVILLVALVAALGAGFALFAFSGRGPSQSLSQKSEVHPIATAQQISARVNIAGRQRMLTQRIVMATCFAQSDIDTDANQRHATNARETFGRTLSELRDGAPLLELPRETESDVLVTLLDVDPHWKRFDSLLGEFETKEAVSPDDLLTLNSAAEQLLKSSDAVTFRIAQTYKSASADLPLEKTLVIDLAGRQRMLTQRALKNACLIHNAPRAQLFRDDLAQTVRLFDATLDALRFGETEMGIPRATHPDLTEQLAIVAKFWPAVKRTLDDLAAGSQLNDVALATLARRTETLLEALERTVKTYETVARL